MTERSPDHFLMLLKQYWFLIIFGVGIVGTLTTVWFELEYIRKAVSPETVMEFRVDAAVLETKREIRWCLGKLVVLDTIEKEAVLKCAD